MVSRYLEPPGDQRIRQETDARALVRVARPGANDRVYSATRLATLVESLSREGVSAADALRGTHVAPQALFTPGTRVSLNQLIAACRNAIRLSRDPHFAFRAGSRSHVTTVGMFGFALLSSVTFRQAIGVALQYHQLAAPLCDFSFSQGHERGNWTLHPLAHPDINAALSRFLVEFELAAGFTLARDIMGSSFACRAVRVAFEPPRDASVYRGMFGCAVLFGQRESQLVFDATWLHRAPQLGNAITHAEVVKLCDVLMDEMRLRMGLSGRVREVLLLNVMRQMSLEEVANRLHLTARTLRRRLREEQTSFRALVDDLRMRLAIRYLRETDLTTQALAHSLGFSDDAAFRHAFRRWTKASPLEYRSRLRGREALAPSAALEDAMSDAMETPPGRVQGRPHGRRSVPG